ncbi:enoyl-CoA hydratase-related protein [Pseudomonas sp. O64]|uniref:enoyl-CoA hydratase-related protein n=1 Tax=Pseudomonas TaxID=286 RepID=UPI000BA15DD4|nr:MULTISPECIES: enoyl-CoA hydratase-related protein [unclassified Pseudomonas]MCV2230585.1 enoyl-CoA hydratase-related protein [Pseudomonas sp. AU10]OZO01497.1 enoyl-CoA hydratase [Pseudomonas sp. IB20]UNM17812.1 enoyl-CoA hydratase/isomerase family protein [Pseudomonas sp. ArH3a]UXZ20606.1 enoyl-CoA hydratase/isomerase family protein [Pseudomonas sp. YeP6b]
MNVLVERYGRVVLVRLNRPQVKNALSSALMTELISSLATVDLDPQVGCFVITGTAEYFAAGADIKEMSGKSYVDMLNEDYFVGWEAFSRLRTPTIAAVAGYAFGGGCELAMMCDMIFAADTATFAQPEIKLGVIPGMGATQRLTGLIGKAKTMDLVLTGRAMTAAEAEQAGLVSRVYPAADLLAQTLAVAAQIAGFSRTATRAAREAVEQSLEVGLHDGVRLERRLFHGLFATPDQQEGMQAFLNKRPALFNRI